MRDMTKQVISADGAAPEPEQELRLAVKPIPTLVWRAGPNGNIEYVNKRVLEYAGAPVSEVIGLGWMRKIHPQKIHPQKIHPDDVACGKPVFDAYGEFRGYRRTSTDVTAILRAQRAEASLRRVQAELARVSRVTTLGQLTASIAHEVTQPLASARNNARAALNFLDKQPPDLGEVREALSCIVGDTDRAGNIIERIRDHVKKTPPQKHRFDLNEAINEAIGLARSAIAENAVSLHIHFTEKLPPVQGDRVQLQQVLLNLVLNAVEAMDAVKAEARELSISTEQTQTKGVLVAVRDSGPGVDPENLDRVFEAFYTTKFNGVGMGLAICRSIIEAHGGRLWAEANELRGGVFRFTLPNAENS
jgi:C4-dicarboxylate-specific signal transduction histidine kinase